MRERSRSEEFVLVWLLVVRLANVGCCSFLPWVPDEVEGFSVCKRPKVCRSICKCHQIQSVCRGVGKGEPATKESQGSATDRSSKARTDRRARQTDESINTDSKSSEARHILLCLNQGLNLDPRLQEGGALTLYRVSHWALVAHV